MPNEIVRVKIANQKKQVCEYELELCEESSEQNDSVRLILKNREPITPFCADNYFEALKKLRRYLEETEEQILCKGSQENVFPSAMQLNAGSGRDAYVLELGKQAKLVDIVDIFEECNFEHCVSCEKQEHFFEKWIESLNRQPKDNSTNLK